MFELRDAFGMMNRVDSSDPDVIRTWLLERIGRITEGQAPGLPVVLMVWPMPLPGQRGREGETDWPLPARREGYQLAPAGLERLAAWLEAEMGQA